MAVSRRQRDARASKLHERVDHLQASIRRDLAEWQQARMNVHRYRLRAEHGSWEALAGGRVRWDKTITPWGDGEQGKFDTAKHNVEMAEYYESDAHALAASMGADAKQVEELRARIARLERPTWVEWCRELLWPLDIYLACRLAKSGKRA